MERTLLIYRDNTHFLTRHSARGTMATICKCVLTRTKSNNSYFDLFWRSRRLPVILWLFVSFLDPPVRFGKCKYAFHSDGQFALLWCRRRLLLLYRGTAIFALVLVEKGEEQALPLLRPRDDIQDR